MRARVCCTEPSAAPKATCVFLGPRLKEAIGKLNRLRAEPHTRDMSAYTTALTGKWSLFVSLVDCEHALTSIHELFTSPCGVRRKCVLCEEGRATELLQLVRGIRNEQSDSSTEDSLGSAAEESERTGGSVARGIGREEEAPGQSTARIMLRPAEANAQSM